MIYKIFNKINHSTKLHNSSKHAHLPAIISSSFLTLSSVEVSRSVTNDGTISNIFTIRCQNSKTRVYLHICQPVNSRADYARLGAFRDVSRMAARGVGVPRIFQTHATGSGQIFKSMSSVYFIIELFTSEIYKIMAEI